MDHKESWIAGWYGKIPSLGDFASRRLPASFIDPWDSWLQHGMAASRAQLGQRWLNVYLSSPMWRFMLMPGACGDSIWTGILMPSVDNVERYFPLTIALQIKPCPGVMLSAVSAQTWYAAIERLALASLNINILPDDLDHGLAKHPFPKPRLNDQDIPAQKLATWWQTASLANSNVSKMLSLLPENSLIELFNATAEEMLISSGRGKSIWWKVSPESEITQLLCFAGLPSENYFASLLEENALQ